MTTMCKLMDDFFLLRLEGGPSPMIQLGTSRCITTTALNTMTTGSCVIPVKMYSWHGSLVSVRAYAGVPTIMGVDPMGVDPITDTNVGPNTLSSLPRLFFDTSTQLTHAPINESAFDGGSGTNMLEIVFVFDGGLEMMDGFGDIAATLLTPLCEVRLFLLLRVKSNGGVATLDSSATSISVFGCFCCLSSSI